MIDPFQLLIFLPAALALALIPGPEMLFCIGQGARFGAPRAMRAALGMTLGAMAGAAIAGLGLAALAARLPEAFTLIRWLGAGYLLWLAWRSLSAGGDTGGRGGGAVGGLLVGLTNPKGAAFSLALLPQFMDPARALLPQALILGAVMAGCALAVNCAAGVLAARLGTALTAAGAGARADRWLRRASAGIFGCLALRVIAGGKP